MIDTTTLQIKVDGYRESCRTSHHKPTYKGISIILGISDSTVANVVHGYFNGKEYTATPHATRCIDNGDFDLIKGLFGNPCE